MDWNPDQKTEKNAAKQTIDDWQINDRQINEMRPALHSLSRRDFLTTSGLLAVAAAAPRSASALAEQRSG